MIKLQYRQKDRKKKGEKLYYIYMLRCQDESIYTGIASNLERRMQEHFNKEKKCAKYTLTHTAKKLEAFWQTENRIQASKLEYHIKRLTKRQKEEVIQDNNNLAKFLSNKLDCSLYTLK